MMESTATTNAFDGFGTRTYGAYGQREASSGSARTGFAGEIGETDLPWYLLGDRFYVPSLQRFISPDTNSPFDDGGLNRYAYCGGDPINRIDPSGEAWWEWVVAGLGLAAAVAATVVSAGALAAPIAAAAAGGLTATVSTTTMVTLTAAVVLDVVAVVAEIGAIASMAAGDEKAMGIFGWVALGTGVASIGLTGLTKVGGNAAAQSGMSAAKPRRLGPRYLETNFSKKGGYKRRTFTSEDGAHRIKVYEGAAAVEKKIPSRAIRNSKGRIVDIRPEWKAYANPAGGVSYVADMGIWSHEGLSNLPAIRAQTDSKPVKFLSGVHGSSKGDNWSRAGKRRGHDIKFYWENRNRHATLQGQVGQAHPLTVVDIGTMSGKDFDQLLGSPDYLVHHYCYSAADPLVIKFFGIKKTVIFVL